MKKIFLSFSILITLFFLFLMTILATHGFETNRFNKFVSNKLAQTKNIDLKLEKIKFKIDLQNLSLFLETQNPIINFRDMLIPVQNIKVYVDFISLLKSEPKIKKINLILNEINISELNKLSSFIKPSNFKSFLNNKVNSGKVFSEIEIFLDKEGTFDNFITRGNIKNLNSELFGGLNLTDTNLSFFADKNDILIKNIFGKVEGMKISDGDIKIELNDAIKLNSNFKSKINLNNEFFNKDIQIIKKIDLLKNIENFQATFNNSFNIELDSTYKILDYNYSFSGKIKESKINFTKSIKYNFIKEKLDQIYLSDLKIKTSFKPKKVEVNCDGKYSFDNQDFQKVNLQNKTTDDLVNLKINFDFKNDLYIDFINYKKSKNSIANVFIDFSKKNNEVRVKEINYKNKDNVIKLNNLLFNKNTFFSFGEVLVNTPNNNFTISNNEKILINGKKFDATNLIKAFNNQSNTNKFKNINKDIEVNFNNIQLPMSEKLQNFKLLGEIKEGKFVKISSKGDFEKNKFLDITMKKDKNSERKYLEIYSDLTRPLLSEYSFFNGLSGGKLFYVSIIDKKKYNAKLTIENFKIVNAPGVVKLLSLADLGGLADLAEGEGLSFDLLEIDMEKEDNFLKLNEILALGPSISVLMEGYQDKSGLTSLRGTLVPAKTLNKVISKIPVIGNIIIPKEVGEGLFGISFKMKGPKGNIKTSINPIRTLTPRFIQKIVDKRKETK